jgi:hypothetical protein
LIATPAPHLTWSQLIVLPAIGAYCERFQRMRFSILHETFELFDRANRGLFAKKQGWRCDSKNATLI